ncbi:uncharacterized protein L199_000045 [Kwoniella botswanensis]|uniref:uncharacterized protein n=1 Tax=Kwoniella botswanensis TaxID=1268659 RepID=UPI00315D6088
MGDESTQLEILNPKIATASRETIITDDSDTLKRHFDILTSTIANTQLSSLSRQLSEDNRRALKDKYGIERKNDLESFLNEIVTDISKYQCHDGSSWREVLDKVQYSVTSSSSSNDQEEENEDQRAKEGDMMIYADSGEIFKVIWDEETTRLRLSNLPVQSRDEDYYQRIEDRMNRAGDTSRWKLSIKPVEIDHTS